MSQAASIYLYFVAAQNVIVPQYGNLALPMCYLEAGMMSQRLRHAALETGFGVCSVGDISFPRYGANLQLSPDQVLLTAMVAGPLAAAEADMSARTAGPATETTLEERIRATLSEQLPRHMVPATILCVPQLPLTANGKVDRKALMTMELVQAGEPAARHHVAPENGFEKTVVGVLAEMLGRDAISVTDNFFDLGANSARLVKAHQAIQAESGITFPLISMFRFPTVRSLAASIEQRTHQTSDNTSEAVKAAIDRADKQKHAIRNLRNLHKK
jgi:acyl carrier protein